MERKIPGKDFQTKRCSKCQKPVFWESFYKSKKTADGLVSWCKRCMRAKNQEPGAQARVRAWHSANREERNATLRTRYKTDPEFRQKERERARARSRGGLE